MASSDVVVRLRLVGQAAFQSATAAAAGSLERISDAGKQADRGTSAFARGVQKANAPLAAVATMAARGSTALGAVGVAAAGMGLKFNASMEQSKVAFTNLLGSGAEADAMLGRLYKLAATTPFQFPQLVQGTQRMLGFGMAAKDVEPTMRAVGDAVAAAGGGAQQIDRVTLAFGQMQAKGKVSSEELRQMAESGIPALKILQQELGLTGTQLTKQLEGGAIKADRGIGALVKGINRRYGGMAEAQSKTFTGMLSNIKDNAAQTLGILSEPLFGVLRNKVLPAVNDVTKAVQGWAKGGGPKRAIDALRAGFSARGASEIAGYGGALAKVAAVGRVFGTVWRVVSGYVTQLWDALKPIQPFLRNVLLPLLKGFAIGALIPIVSALKLLIPIVRIVATVLGWLGQKLAPLRGFFTAVGVVLGTVFGPGLLRAFTLVTKLSGVLRFLQGVVRVLVAPFVLLSRAVGWVVGGFTRLVGRLLGMRGPVAAVARYFVDLIAKVARLPASLVQVGKDMIGSLIAGITAAPGALVKAVKGLLPGPLRGILGKVTGRQHGGVLPHRGPALVGERGPELLQLPGGARVTPLPQPALAAPALSLAGAGAQTTAHFYLDRRLIATAVAEDTADRQARHTGLRR
jgi:tape measure domain-containing protein